MGTSAGTEAAYVAGAFDTSAATRFRLRTLGELRIHPADRPHEALLANAKPLIVVALLATKPDRPTTREHLAAFLWPDADRAQARRSLRQALFQLSKRTDARLILSDDASETLTLNHDAVTVDLWEFDDAIEHERYERAVELYRGPFLAGQERKGGVEVDHWIEAQNAQILVGLEVAYTKLVSGALSADDTETAVRFARAYAELNPLNDVAQVTLVRALKASGDEVEALRAYQAYRTLLHGVLDDEPAEDLQASMEGVRQELLRRPDHVPSGRRSSEARLRLLTLELRRWRAVALGAAGAAVLLAASLTLGWRLRAPPPPAEPLAHLSGTVLVVAGEGRAQVLEAELGDRNVAFRRSGFVPHELPSPDGTRVAGIERAADGWNLTVRASGQRDARTVTTLPGDEEPRAWSPDGRYLLYTHRAVLEGGRDAVYRVLVHDLETGTERVLAERESREPITATWSPDGSRIAFVADVRRQADVIVTGFDGTGLLNLSDHPDWDGAPAWAPEGSRLAFVSRRSGRGQLFTVRADGGGLRQVTDVDVEVQSPAWLSSTTIVFVAEQSGSRDLWAVHLPTGFLRRLTDRGDMQSILRLDRVENGRSWIERVRVHPQPQATSPGQYLEFRLLVTDGAGRRVTLGEAEAQWSVADPEIASVLRPGLVRVLMPGRTRLVVGVRGWRADTVPLPSSPLVEMAVEPDFVEDWTAGLRASQWITFGEPQPYVRRGGGPQGAGYFVNNGDAHFGSGAVSAPAFSASDGLAVEVFGRMPFTGDPDQRFALALYPEGAASGDWVETPPLLEVAIQGPTGSTEGEMLVTTAEHGTRIPPPDRLGAWRRYTLQVHADGTVELVVDGGLHWRAPWRTHLPDNVRVGLGSQSQGTEVAHGTVRVYRGVRYESAGSGAPVAGGAAPESSGRP